MDKYYGIIVEIAVKFSLERLKEVVILQNNSTDLMQLDQANRLDAT